MAKEYKFSSQYGIEELINYIETKQSEFSKILITDRYDQPYILTLFYLKYPPADFQNNHNLTPKDQFGFSTVRKFGKFEFRGINFDEDRPIFKNTLIIGTDEEIYDEANVTKEIIINGHKYFQIVEN